MLKSKNNGKEKTFACDVLAQISLQNIFKDVKNLEIKNFDD